MCRAEFQGLNPSCFDWTSPPASKSEGCSESERQQGFDRTSLQRSWTPSDLALDQKLRRCSLKGSILKFIRFPFSDIFYKMFSEWSEAEVRFFETSVTAWFWSERGWVYSIFCSWSWHRQGAIELAAGSDWNASQRLKSEGCLATLLVPNLERASLKVTKTSNGWRNSTKLCSRHPNRQI